MLQLTWRSFGGFVLFLFLFWLFIGFLLFVFGYFLMVFSFDVSFLSFDFGTELLYRDLDLWSAGWVYFFGEVFYFYLLLLLNTPEWDWIIFLLGERLMTSSSYWSSSRIPLMMVLVFWSIYEIYCSESSSYSPDYSLMISEYKRYSSILICFLLSKSTATCTF